jgi:biotin transporter BioY
MNTKRTTWTIVFVSCILSHAIIAAFGTTWFSIIASTIPLLGAVSSFSYLYNQGRGVPDVDNEARRPNR